MEMIFGVDNLKIHNQLEDGVNQDDKEKLSHTYHKLPVQAIDLSKRHLLMKFA